jgi:hypothetical protein
LGDGQRPLSERLLDGNDPFITGRLNSVAGASGPRELLARAGRCAAGVDWHDALRERLRTSWTVSAVGIGVYRCHSTGA